MAIPFVIVNLDKPREMKLNFKVMIEFEKTNKMKITNIGSEDSIEMWLKLMYTMLRQEDKELTLEKTIALVDENLTPEEAIELVSECIYNAFPKRRPKKEESPNENKPTTRQNG
jgi:hypothetical protein